MSFFKNTLMKESEITTLELPKRKKRKLQTKTRVKKKKSVKKKLGCEICKAFEKCSVEKSSVIGKGEKKILILSDYPHVADRGPNPIRSPENDYLNTELKTLGLNLLKDCWKVSAVNCRPRKLAKATTKQINNCRVRFQELMKELQPEKVIVLGHQALTVFLGDRMSGIKELARWIGYAIPDQTYQCMMYPIDYRGTVSIRKFDQDSVAMSRKIFTRHLSFAVSDGARYQKDKEVKIVKLKTEEETVSFLQSLLETPPEYLSFDYEATGLFPAQGHQVRCASVCTDESTTYVFLMTENILSLWRKVLNDPSTKKIAHNMKFEHNWSKYILGADVQNWNWDSMLAAHVLDNRAGICGLKFQVYKEFGITGYDDSIASYLRTSGDDIQEKNRVFEAPVDELLEYCALDAWYTFRLAMHQKKNMGKLNYQFLHDGIVSFFDLYETGIPIDEVYYGRVNTRLGRKIDRLSEQIKTLPEVQKWNEEHEKPLNLGSPKQLGKFLFEDLGLTVLERTKTGAPSTGEEVLQKLDHPVAQNIVEMRKLLKLKDTYVGGFLRKSFGGVLRPSFNLHTVKTFRSSAQDPNFQNVPKKDVSAQKLIRLGVKPHKGQFLVCADYSGMEVNVSCFYHKDPKLIAYRKDSNSDMHGDESRELFFLTPEQATSKLRYYAKNSFVFPEFYGDYYKNCAKGLWEGAQKEKTGEGVPVLEHLRRHGISKYLDFENHVKQQEHILWYKKFNTYRLWKEKTLKHYYKTGTVELLTGFVCSTKMEKNDVLNYQIQGTAFHLLLWSLQQINKELKGYKSNVIGQIHDEVVLSVQPEESDFVYHLITDIMTKKVADHWNWINVPMEVDLSVSEVDGSWFGVQDLTQLP